MGHCMKKTANTALKRLIWRECNAKSGVIIKETNFCATISHVTFFLNQPSIACFRLLLQQFDKALNTVLRLFHNNTTQHQHRNAVACAKPPAQSKNQWHAVPVFNSWSALMLSTFNTKGTVMTASQTPGCKIYDLYQVFCWCDTISSWLFWLIPMLFIFHCQYKYFYIIHYHSCKDITSLWQKSETQNQKNIFSLQTRRLAKLFQHLNSTLALSSPELCPCKAMYKQPNFMWIVWIKFVIINPSFTHTAVSAYKQIPYPFIWHIKGNIKRCLAWSLMNTCSVRTRAYLSKCSNPDMIGHV